MVPHCFFLFFDAEAGPTPCRPKQPRPARPAAGRNSFSRRTCTHAGRSRLEAFTQKVMRLSRLLWTLPLAPPPLRLRSPCMAGNKYGRKDYWDDLYRGSGSDGLPAEAFSWYCGWSELEPFWSELVASGTPRVLVPGMGNDRSLVELYDAGWRDVTAFDYSEDAVTRDVPSSAGETSGCSAPTPPRCRLQTRRLMRCSIRAPSMPLGLRATRACKRRWQS